MENEVMVRLLAEVAESGKEESLAKLKAPVYSCVDGLIRAKNFRFWPSWDEEDFKSEVFTRVYRNAASYDESRAHFSTWVKMLAEGIYFNVRKREKKLVTVPDVVPDPETGEEISIVDLYLSAPSCEDEVMLREDMEYLRSSIEKLPWVQREAMELNLQGLSGSEAAEIQGCDPENAYRRLCRARRKLRERAYFDYEDR
ncbi:MAG: sigma-70 family RNA polymerase sigma factor [Lachnospiraceae bacterium]|nr:sigma-70 family RNA polymerase sigma factor [Lachnospiraceae bacterium]